MEKIDFIVHPRRAIPDFVGRGNSVATGSGLAGKTAADRGEINLGANLFFVHPAKLLEPAEERPSGRPREWFSEHRLFHAGRLTDQHDFARNGTAGDRRRQHARAATALSQERDVLVEQLLSARETRHSRSAAKHRHEQGDHDADDNAGNDREVECQVPALNANVARKPSQPARAETGPKREADDRDYAAENG